MTVVIPAYNVEQYLRESVASVLTQTFSDFELVIVNDGSSDETLGVARELQLRDDRIRIIDRQNGGLSVARNTGTAEAHGRYVLYVDADDALLPRALEVLVESLERTGSDIAVGAYARWNNSGRRVPDWIAALHGDPASQVTVDERPDVTANVIAMPKLYRRSFLNEHDLWFVPGILYEDQDFAARVYCAARGIDILGDRIYLWRVRDDFSSISQQIQEIANSSALMEAVSTAVSIYRESGHPDVARHRLEHMMAVDLPPLATAAANGSEEHRDEFRRITGALLRTADVGNWLSVPLERRVRLYHAYRGRWEELLAFDELLRTQGSPLPVDVGPEGDVRLIPHPFAHESWRSVPGWLHPLTETDRRMTVYLRDAEIDGTDVVVFGCAFVRGMSSSPHDRLAAALVHVSGARLELDVVTQTDPDYNRWASHRAADYSGAGFRVAIPLAEALARHRRGAWHLEVTFSRREFSSSSGVTHVNGGRATGRLLSPRLDVQGTHGTAAIKLSKVEGFSVVFRPDEVRAVELLADRARSTLRLVVQSQHVLLSASLRDRTRPARVKHSRAKRRGPDEFAFSFSFAKSTPETVWELKTVGRDGKTSLVTWAADDAPTAVDFGWAPTPRRYVEARTFDSLLFVESATIGRDGLGLEITGSSVTREQASSLRLVSPRAAVAGANVEEISPRRFRVSIPWSSESFGFHHPVPPSGHYSLDWLTSAKEGRWRQVRLSGEAIERTPRTVLLDDLVLADVWMLPTSGAFRLTLGPPLAPEERGLNGQARLTEEYRARDYDARAAVFFQCYRGDVVGDSQLAIHRELTRRGCGLQLDWGVADRSVSPPEGGTAHVIGTRAWYDAIGSATYLCNNIDFDRFFMRRSHQTVVSTFHGHPFKAMGRLMWEVERVPEFRMRAELTRRQAEWSVAVVPSDEAGELYREQYEYGGVLAVTGYPRDDRLASPSPHERAEVLRRIGVDPSKKVVLYAPTWRETLATSQWTASLFDGLDLDTLARSLGDEYAILLRGHGHNARGGAKSRSQAVVDVTQYPSIEDLVIAADVAVLDYSSLRFDWAVTEKPAIFFVPDRDEYFARRPTLLRWEDTRPGPEAATTDEVAALLEDLDGLRRSTLHSIRSFNARFNALNDGGASSRLIDLVARISDAKIDADDAPAF